MKKQTLAILLFFVSFLGAAQIKGSITEKSGVALPGVSIFIEGTYNGTSANDQGNYFLQVTTPGTYTVVYQMLGFKTQKIKVVVQNGVTVQNVVLVEEELNLQEVVINAKENPADRMIREAIKARKSNSERTSKFTADFYSRGMFKIKDLPKKLFGQEVGDLGGMVDSTGSGIIYLSETVSKIVFQKPDELKETIIASKVSGNDKGYSYNTARSTAYDFYDNNVRFATAMISPISSEAFSYYKYKIAGSFMDDSKQMVYKIQVTSKRDSEPTFDGFIYIVDDSYAIYAVDLSTKGYRMRQEFIDTLTITQQFAFNQASNLWSKNVQALEFQAGAFGIKFTGKFNYVYSNYNFELPTDKKLFGREMVVVERESNKKDDSYWNQFRPIPLTNEEFLDYKKKDSITTVRSSKVYLDSVDGKKNKFKFFDIIKGYTYQNSYKKYRLAYDGVGSPLSYSFNTVQGWNLNSGFGFYRESENEESGREYSVRLNLNYGFAEDRLRYSLRYNHRFNRINNDELSIEAGIKAEQFNSAQPISPLVNSVASLFFKNNFMKLYNREFISATFSRYLAPGFYASLQSEWSQRRALQNNTDYTLIKNEDDYLSNNPLQPNNDALAFEQHSLAKVSLGLRYNFGVRYITRPDSRLQIRDSDYPTLYLNYLQAFAGSNSDFNYSQISGRIVYELDLNNKGSIAMQLKGGKLFNAENISFIDYQHFNGNQTNVNNGGRYLNVFNLLPYYSASTNDSYSEIHAEYNDAGYFINKIPLLNLLKTNLIIGAHQLAVPDRKPYQEFSIGLDKLGFGKFRQLRLDYVRSYQGGFVGDGILFGIKFLNFVD
ncbi:DUF5686 and carboxypeptidase regulatory-like domain-containing protein [Flavobacterium sp.]|uniref:DUF5686 and carboxypeptidase regulatory-like domain-containing protein n=1 Tax=Flavobacterium sp. TaxID=239 RepID=UPI002631A440|nr:DUF5686 and carboxypeptidase regulatory-like domain-containing protein [Flavobacterium sp.]